ncbi:MAG: Gfo/Idh/MocA family oxidoreductase [Bdellovibrionales bacterium]|jgi:predicted dehydrogenase|nr:Gfo/Idh/MocA family oxidoreductase [Bdellovibrionales bacterium]
MTDFSKTYPGLRTIAVIGGGRWARVIIDELMRIVPSTTTISVHTPRNIVGMSEWAAKRDYKNITVHTEFLPFKEAERSAAIVANAACNHEVAVRHALDAGVAVLVEKPVTLFASSTRELYELAKKKGLYFASAHVYMFARYISFLAKWVLEDEPITHIGIVWNDQHAEVRYGEQKTFDQSLPIYADCLPHILSVIEMLVPELSFKFQSLRLNQGGAHLEMDISLERISCKVEMKRNSGTRQRIINVESANRSYICDFSKEPVRMSCDAVDVDYNEDIEPRPLECLLRAFLTGAVTGKFDPRLDIRHGLRVNYIIDEVANKYAEEQRLWLANALTDGHSKDCDGLLYGVGELLLAKNLTDSASLQMDINRIINDCSERDKSYILEYFNNL